MRKIKIKIDQKKCIKPEECRACLSACPPGVFNLIFLDEDYHEPENWIIDPVFPLLCLKIQDHESCHKCVEACPKQAIEIIL